MISMFDEQMKQLCWIRNEGNEMEVPFVGMRCCIISIVVAVDRNGWRLEGIGNLFGWDFRSGASTFKLPLSQFLPLQPRLPDDVRTFTSRPARRALQRSRPCGADQGRHGLDEEEEPQDLSSRLRIVLVPRSDSSPSQL